MPLSGTLTLGSPLLRMLLQPATLYTQATSTWRPVFGSSTTARTASPAGSTRTLASNTPRLTHPQTRRLHRSSIGSLRLDLQLLQTLTLLQALLEFCAVPSFFGELLSICCFPLSSAATHFSFRFVEDNTCYAFKLAADGKHAADIAIRLGSFALQHSKEGADTAHEAEVPAGTSILWILQDICEECYKG